MCISIREVRRLPGFGDIPVRLPAATITRSDSVDQNSTSKLTQQIGFGNEHTVKPTQSQPLHTKITPTPTLLQLSVTDLLNRNTSTSKTSSGGGLSTTKTPSGGGMTSSAVTNNSQPEVIDLSSDIDDDIQLYSSSDQTPQPLYTAKRKNSLGQ